MQTIKANWSAPSNVYALTTVRHGGVSAPPFDTLNLGDHVGDDQAAVLKNRNLVTEQLNLPSEPLWLTQTHSTRILNLGEKHPTMPLDTNVDGIFCQRPGQVCVVMSADCMPLLLSNRKGTKIAALHAGWRGMADGIIEQGVALFEEQPDQLLAYAGPCISRKYFEVGSEVRDQLGGVAQAYASHADDPNKCYADLYALAGERLAQLGVTDFNHHKYCTYQDKDLFFSYRRENQCGRIASLIWME